MPEPHNENPDAFGFCLRMPNPTEIEKSGNFCSPREGFYIADTTAASLLWELWKVLPWAHGVSLPFDPGALPGRPKLALTVPHSHVSEQSSQGLWSQDAGRVLGEQLAEIPGVGAASGKAV